MNAALFFEKTQGAVSEAFLERLSEAVRAAEAELATQCGSRVMLAEAIGRHTLQAGGKRMRPALVALAAEACGLSYDAERVRKLGACMEMIHMATLIHDDVIDRAATRRGQETASAVYGNTASILSGDALLAKAMRLLALDGDLATIRAVSEAVVDLAEGEVRELEIRGRIDLPREAHFEVLHLKTASFIQCCCEVGARIAGGTEAQREALGAYGYRLGMAFQIVDDLLDYRGDHAKTGKPRATDFVEGCATLPLIALLAQVSPEERAFLEQRFGQSPNEADLDALDRWMRSHGAYRVAEEEAEAQVRAGIEALEIFPDSEAKRMMLSTAEFVLARQA